MQRFIDAFDRHVRYLEKTHPNREELGKRFDEVLLKVISTRDYITLQGLSMCKDFAGLAEWLSKREGKSIKPDSVRRRADRALRKVTGLLDETVDSLAEYGKTSPKKSG